MKTNFHKPSSIIFLSALLLFFSQILNAQTLSLQLTASDFNGFNISCFGNQNGTIDLTVSGGTAPYKYQWSNDAQTEDLSDLPSGYYHVAVTDANQQTSEAEITLTEPKPIKVELNAYKYPNGFNISQNGSCNGNVAATVSGGVTPYTYHWNPGNQTIANPTNLCAGVVAVVVVDNNSCGVKENTVLSQPEKDSWLSAGNGNTNPQNQFIGTTDNTDMVIRTNGIERLRLGGNGTLNLHDLTGSGLRSLTVDAAGNLSRSDFVIGYRAADQTFPEIMSFGGIPSTNPMSVASCVAPVLNTQTNYQFNGTIQLWGNNVAGGNLDIMEVGFDGSNCIIDATGTSTNPIANRLLINYYCGKDVLIGNNNSGDLRANHDFFVSGTSKFTGNVGIGTTPDANYKLQVCGKIRAKEIVVEENGWCDFVFEDSYKRMSISERKEYLKIQKHLPYIASAKEISSNGLQLKETMKGLTQNVEEMNLDLIESHSEIQELKRELLELKSELKALRKK